MHAYTRDQIHTQLRNLVHQMFADYGFDGSPDKFYVAVMEGVQDMTVEQVESLCVSADPHHAFILCAWLCHQHDIIVSDDRYVNAFTLERTFEEIEGECDNIDDLLYDFGDELLKHMNRFDQVSKLLENRSTAKKYKNRVSAFRP